MRPSALSLLIRGVVILVFVGLGFLSPSPVQAQQTCPEVGGDCRPITQDGICFAGEVIDNSGSCEGAGVKCCAAPSCGDRGGACQPGATACATGTTALGNASCSSGLCCTQPTDGPTCGELLGHGNGQCVQYSDACPASHTNAGPTRDCMSCCNPGGSAPPLPGPGGAGYKVEFIHTDALGSVRLVTDQSGGVVSRHDYRPFGEEIGPGTNGRGTIGGYVPSAEDPWRLRERFTGKERDGESGLDYFGARYYSSAQGRFTTPDAPFADQYEEAPQSWNLYSYTRNNPLKYVDDDGRALKVITSGIKVLVKGGDVASTFAGVTEAVAIIASGNPAVGTGARLLAVGSLLGEVSGVSDVLKGAKGALNAVDGVGDAARRVPNPGGKLGGPEHRAKVAEVAADVESRGLVVVPELKVPTPGGSKGTRFVDVAGRDPRTGNIVERHQVGKQTKKGAPIARERRAIDDIENACPPGTSVCFHAYNPQER